MPFIKQKKMKKQMLVIATALMLLNSCATILDGSKTRVKVHGSKLPVSAKIYYNGEYKGTAPMKLRIQKSSIKAGGILEIKADGYETETIQLSRKMRTGFVILDIIPGVGLALAIDIANGNINRVHPKKVEFNLQKK